MTNSNNTSKANSRSPHKAGSSDFIIVDNADPQRNVLTYLRQWCDVSSSIDIATGYFDVGALLALDGHWQKLEKLRILIGDETSHRTGELIRRVRETVDKTAVLYRVDDPYLTGLDAVVQAIITGQIEIKIFTNDFS